MAISNGSAQTMPADKNQAWEARERGEFRRGYPAGWNFDTTLLLDDRFVFQGFELAFRNFGFGLAGVWTNLNAVQRILIVGRRSQNDCGEATLSNVVEKFVRRIFTGDGADLKMDAVA